MTRSQGWMCQPPARASTPRQTCERGRLRDERTSVTARPPARRAWPQAASVFPSGERGWRQGHHDRWRDPAPRCFRPPARSQRDFAVPLREQKRTLGRDVAPCHRGLGESAQLRGLSHVCDSEREMPAKCHLKVLLFRSPLGLVA